MKKLFIFAIAAVGLISCEGNTNKEYVVTNNSSNSITVKYHFLMTGENFTHELPAGSTKSIIEIDQRGGQSEGTNVSDAFSEFYIINSLNDTCQKDETFDANWIILVDRISNIPSQYDHEYTFKVDDTNF